MNRVAMVGNLTRDPELRKTSGEWSVCTFSIAVNRPHDREKTDFFTVVTWRALAENCARYLSKGRRVAVSGHLENRSYDDKNGVKRWVTEIIADEVEFLSSVTRDAGSVVDMTPAESSDPFDGAPF